MLPNFLLLNQVYDIFSGYIYGKSCFPIVGCFDNGAPWTTLNRPVLPPERPNKTHPFFFFHNRDFPQGIAYEIFPKANFTNFSSDANKTSYVIVHGYTDKGKLPWILELKDLLIDKNDVNVFVLDYSKGGGGNYAQAVGNIRLFGRIYALAFRKTGIPSSKFHIIGHSLGSQLASYIAKEMKKMGFPVGWLTGLDPAAPLFENYPVEIRIDSSDADFVDIHHTDSGVRGMLKPIGHVDFYYNGGTTQPCVSETFDAFGCGHQMVHEYYISSIRNKCIYGVPSTIKKGTQLLLTSIIRGPLTKYKTKNCTPESCLQVGIETKDFPQRGIFSIFLDRNPPYCSKNFSRVPKYMTKIIKSIKRYKVSQ